MHENSEYVGSGDTPEPFEFTFEFYLDHRAKIEADVGLRSCVPAFPGSCVTVCRPPLVDCR